MKAKFAAVALAIASAISAPAAVAGSSSQTMTVYFEVVTGCTLSYAGAIWGTYDQGRATPTTGTSQAQVVCASGTPYTLSYDQGVNAAADSSCLSPQRRAGANGSYVSYELYQDSALTKPLGCDATNQLSSTGAEGRAYHDIHWRVPAKQESVKQNGMHTDTVTATITF